jgi:spermidine synthase
MSERAPRALLAAMFSTTLVTLALQVAMSRVLSVTLSYHFAFLIVAFAMLGMSASAVRVFLEGDDAEKGLGPAAAARVAAVLITLGTFGFVFTPTSNRALIAVQLTIAGALLAGAFYYSGYVVAYVLSRWSRDVARLYLVDLAGAAAGCLVAVVLLNQASALTVTLACGCLSAGAAVLVDRTDKKSLGLFAALSVLTLAAFASPSVTRLRYAKLRDQRHVMWEKWNDLARVAVYPPDASWEAGWGMSKAFTGVMPENLLLDLDASALTSIVHHGADGPPETTEFLRWDVTASGYWLREGRIGSVFIIGGGGGRDVLTATKFGAKEVRVVEINPAVIEASRDVFGSYSGGIYSLPQVKLSVGNARSKLSQSDERFDVIQMSMIDTWAASMSGQLVLSENTLYTKEAFALFTSHLKDDGILSVSRWYDRTNFGEVARVLVLMGDSLSSAGAAHPSEHIAILYTDGYVGPVATTLMKRSPFTPEEIDELATLARRMRFRLLWPAIADLAVRDPIDIRACIDRDPTYARASVFDLEPPSDERPFFFNTKKPLASWIATFRNGEINEGSQSSGILFGTLVILTLVGLRLLIWPLRRSTVTKPRELWTTHRAPSLYFLGIGVGFMLSELALIQRFIVFLGHPTYGLSVVLFSLLLFTGIGSAVSGRLGLGAVRFALGGVIACALLAAFAVPPLLTSIQGWSLAARVVIAGALIAPLGACMGMAFPTGIRLLGATGRDVLVPWMWGLNGFAGVIASVLGMMLATTFGYTSLLLVAAASYALTFVAARTLLSRAPSTAVL